MLQPTKGPFTLDVDELFEQASVAVRSRRDVVDQLGTLHLAPDLAEVIESQRPVLISGVADSLARCEELARQLHQPLVFALPAKDRDRLRAMVDRVTIFQRDPLDPALARTEAAQVALLDKYLPSVRDNPEFTSLVTEWNAIRQDTMRSLESSMVSLVLTALNSAAADELSLG